MTSFPSPCICANAHLSEVTTMDLLKALNVTLSTPINGDSTATTTANQAPNNGFAALFAALQTPQPSALEDKLPELPEWVAELEDTTELEQLSAASIEEILGHLLPQHLRDALAQEPRVGHAIVGEHKLQPAEEGVDPQPILAPVAMAVAPAPSSTASTAPAVAAAPTPTVMTSPAAMPTSTNAAPIDAELPQVTTSPAALVPEPVGNGERLVHTTPVMPQPELTTAATAPAVTEGLRPLPTHFQSAIVMLDTPVNTTPTATQSAPVGSSAWAGQLQQNMVSMVLRNQQEMTLRLHPAELGPLQVQLRVDDHQAQLMILTHSHHVRGAVEQALPQLREALATQGIQLDDANVADHAQHFAQQQQQQNHAQQQNRQAHPVENTVSAENTDMAALSTPASRPLNGQVDTYA